MSLTDTIKDEARRLGFSLAGITTPEPPPHWKAFEHWLSMGRHGAMDYLTDSRRADPRLVLPGCRSIMMLAVSYPAAGTATGDKGPRPTGRVAAYAWGYDYHLVLPKRLRMLAAFIEAQVGSPIPHRWYTDTGPLLERDLAQRAGLGWIGKNTCLIHPKIGSYFLLAEILLGIELEPDMPYSADRCGKCTRCITACPTGCILPDRTLDARRCLSYLTIENKKEIPLDLRPQLGNWIFGCDICQQICPWNRFANQEHDPVFNAKPGLTDPDLVAELALRPQEFNRKFKDNPVLRSKRGGYLRNVAVVLGNSGNPRALPALEKAFQDDEPLVCEHAAWALQQIRKGQHNQEWTMYSIQREHPMRNLLIATNNKGKVDEIKALLDSLGLVLITPADLGLTLEVIEDGQTYAENAGKKATAYAQASGMIALGDDSGLEVDALGGQPGLHSHRFCPIPNATDADRRNYLLERLGDHQRPWTARFRATVAIALPSGMVKLTSGQCEGEIVPDERGANGFGYDPIFFIPEIGHTMAELDMKEKNRLSHRARAIQNAIPILKEFLGW